MEALYREATPLREAHDADQALMGRPVDRKTFRSPSSRCRQWMTHHEMGRRPAKLKSLLRCAINAGLPCPAARTVARAGQRWWRDWRRPHERPADRLASIDACGEARQPQTSRSVGRVAGGGPAGPKRRRGIPTKRGPRTTARNPKIQPIDLARARPGSTSSRERPAGTTLASYWEEGVGRRQGEQHRAIPSSGAASK